MLLFWLSGGILSYYLVDHYELSFIAGDRLGHREQKDEWAPRIVDVFTRHNTVPPNAIVSAGSANSACTAGEIGLLLARAFSISSLCYSYTVSLHLYLTFFCVYDISVGNLRHNLVRRVDFLDWLVGFNCSLCLGMGSPLH